MFTMFLGPVKAGFELICGDSEGAERTLEEFSQTNPIIAPLRGGAEFLAGDTEAGKKTFSKLGGALESALNTTPVVGHVKGVCHALGGDVQKGREIYLQVSMQFFFCRVLHGAICYRFFKRQGIKCIYI